MKIAILIDTWFPFVGGGQINAWEISRRIARKGYKIDIITRNCGESSYKGVKNLSVYKLGSKTSSDIFFSKIIFAIQAFFFVNRRDYDLVHAHAFVPGVTACLLMIFKGLPAVFTVHGTSINTKLNNVFSRILEKLILTRILYSVQITVSRDFLKIKNVNKNVYYIPNGVDTRAFDKIKIKKLENPTLIFVGRLHKQKNLENLISAMNIVRISIPNIRLVIIGKGELKVGLQKQVKDLELTENVKFLGQKIGKDLIKLYKSSHVFILPSIYEGQPLTLFEAWACKLPVVVTKSGDCTFLVKENFNGFLIENARDTKDISGSILKALKSKNLPKIGEHGYNFAKKNFSWDESARSIFRIYSNCVT